MNGMSEQCFRNIESCLNYRAYIYDIDPELSPATYAAMCHELTRLGRAEKERMGVIYVHGPWGFFVIPKHGFPELRINFYHDIPISEIRDVMASICAIFSSSDAALHSGDMNE